MPSTETLMAISRSENVRLDWLMMGEGQPFQVNRCRSDAECEELLSSFLDEDWKIYFVGDGRRSAVVLTQPGQYQIGERWVDYTIIEIISGAVGKLCLERIRAYLDERGGADVRLYHVAATADTLNDLCAGKMGTWLITKAPNHLLHGAKLMAARDMAATKTEEEPESYAADDEQRLIHSFRQLSGDDRKKALQIISVLKHTV